jgi:hypothetical protein
MSIHQTTTGNTMPGSPLAKRKRETEKQTETTVVILNGPPNCGKDTVADHVISLFKDKGLDVCKREFKTPLIEATCNFYDISKTDWDAHYTRELKDVPWDRLGGLSQRQALIRTSEKVVKPALGEAIFGQAAANSFEPGYCHIFSDGGFDKEIEPIVKVTGPENVLIIHMSRDGCTFDGDSRSYIEPCVFGTAHTNISNNGSVSEILERITNMILLYFKWMK